MKPMRLEKLRPVDLNLRGVQNCLPGTQLVLTLTSGMREVVEANANLRLVGAARTAPVPLSDGVASPAERQL